jgi:NAD-dependent deacetylase
VTPPDPDLRATRDRLVAEAHADPLAPTPRFNLAVALRLLGQLDAARALAHDALTLGAPAAPTLALLGLLDLLALRPRDAHVRLQRALDADPDHAVSWVYLGLARGALGDRAGALAAFEHALQAPAARRLPALVQTRVALQRDALADTPDARLLGSRCAVCAITEWITADGQIELGPPPDAAAATGVTEAPAPALRFDELVERIDAAKRLVVLSGAGLSAESGLPTRKALWSLHARDAAVSVAGFVRNPAALWSAARTFAGESMPAPNAGHLAIARLPSLAGVVTQNIDGLHQRARRDTARAPEAPVVELHGSFDRALCHACGALDRDTAWTLLHQGPGLPRCRACRGPLRPDVVLFGEAVPDAALRDAIALVREADLLLVVGCAMDVAPASELPSLVRASGCDVVELNRSPSRLGRRLGVARYEGLAGETLARVYAWLGSRHGWPGVSFPRAVTGDVRTLQRREVVDVPFLGDGATTVREVLWLVKDGELVTADMPVVIVNNDKVDVEVFAPVDGVIRRVSAALDRDVPVGTRLAVIEAPPDARVAVVPDDPEPRRPALPTLPWDGARRSVLVEHFASWRHRDWLRPDRELLDETPEARRWLEDRAAEHCAALEGDLPPLQVAVFHDLAAAVAAWRSEHPTDCAWNRQLLPALDVMARRLEIVGDGVHRYRWQVRSALGAFCDEVWGAVLRGECARRGVSPGARLLDAPLPVVFDLARAVLDGSGELRGPCPWAPLAAIFARGAWPFAVAPDVLGVYVPRAEALREGALTIARHPPRFRDLHPALTACLPPLALDPAPEG